MNPPREPHERSNAVTQMLLRGLVEAGVMRDGVPGIMIVIESLMASIMKLNVEQFGLTPQQSANLLDLAYQRALEKFVSEKE